MDWLERLNRSLGRIPLGQGTVELLHWAYDPHLPDNRPHRHTFFEVCLVGAHGQGKFIVQEREHPIGPGDLFVARPGVVHQIVNTDQMNMELFWVSFQWTPPTPKSVDDVDQLLRAFADSPILVAADEQGRLAALWRALQTSAETPPGLGSERQREALASALLIGIAQAASGPSLRPPEEASRPDADDRTARLAVRFIHDNLSRPLPLAEIAAQAYVSPRHLSPPIDPLHRQASSAVYHSRPHGPRPRPAAAFGTAH